MDMQNIIMCRDKAMLLLMGIDAYYSSIRKQDQEFANKLETEISKMLTEYEIMKMKTSSKSTISSQAIINDGTEGNIGGDFDLR